MGFNFQETFVFSILWSVVSVCFAGTTAPLQSVCIHLSPKTGPVAQRASQIFAREIHERSGAKVSTEGKAALTVELSVRPGIGTEGFTIADGGKGVVKITGNDENGLLYGVGKFLHTSRYDQKGFTPGTWRGTDVPKGTMRGIYFATHFNNWYQAASDDERQQYMESLALWGTNALSVAFPIQQLAGLDDPKAIESLRQLNLLLKQAKAVGMKVGILGGNQYYYTAPKELRATPSSRVWGEILCPSKPEAMRLLADNWGKLLDRFKETGLDFAVYWPYDEGGCACGRCAPGGLPMVNFPEISMWGTDPIWGGYGANPLPLHFQKLWSQVKGKVAGGFPYSEGIYEDLNKVVCSQFYWNPDQTAEETVREYVAYEFSPTVVDSVLKVVQILDKNLPREMTVRKHLPEDGDWNTPGAFVEGSRIEFTHADKSPLSAAENQELAQSTEEAFHLLQQADSQLPPAAKTGWRWRILYLRALIDYELVKNDGWFQGPELQSAFRELTAIYRGENAFRCIHVPRIEDVKPTHRGTQTPSALVCVPGYPKSIISGDYPDPTIIPDWATECKSKGHGTLIDDVNGNWWIVYHAYKNGFHTLGRHTLIEPVEWMGDGWFRLAKSANPIKPQGPKVKNGMELSDNFHEKTLGLQWMQWRESAPGKVVLKNNGLYLEGKGNTPKDARLLLVTELHHNKFGGFLALRPCLMAAGNGEVKFNDFVYKAQKVSNP